jgi:hypothetical protein
MKKIILLTLAALLIISIIALPAVEARLFGSFGTKLKNWWNSITRKNTEQASTMMMPTAPEDLACNVYDRHGNREGEFEKEYTCWCWPGYNPNNKNAKVKVRFYWGDDTYTTTEWVDPGPKEEHPESKVLMNKTWHWKMEYGNDRVPFEVYATTYDGNHESAASNYWGFALPYEREEQENIRENITPRPILNYFLQRLAQRFASRNR